MWIIWLIIAGVFFVIEMATIGFLVFWLGIGALTAMASSFFIENIYIQTLVFVVSSALLIPLTKPLVDKYISNKPAVPMNSFSLIGKKGVTISEINTTLGTGQIKVNGEVWSARCEDEEATIPANTEVNILKIDGVKLIVEPIKTIKEVNLCGS